MSAFVHSSGMYGVNALLCTVARLCERASLRSMARVATARALVPGGVVTEGASLGSLPVQAEGVAGGVS